MCGRYTIAKVPKSSEVINPDSALLDLKPRYNVAPSQYALIQPQAHPAETHWYRWGLVPAWAKDEKIGNQLINARSETLPEKPSFRDAIHRRRCVVLADGFFEWKKTLAGKVPHWISLVEGQSFGFAGLSESWQSPAGKSVHSFTIITTEPNELMRDIHNRMPAILNPEDAATWLEADLPLSDALALLRPYPADQMRTHSVSPRVGNVRNDDPSLILPVEPPLSLF